MNVQAPFNKTRVDKFVLVMNLPTALKKINSKRESTNKTISLDSLQFSLYKTIVPEIVVPAVETRYTGGNIYISSHNRPSHPPISVGFNIDNRFNNYWTIYQWLNLMRDEKEGVYGIVNSRQLADPEVDLSDYATTFNLYAKDEFNENIIRFDYHRAFPTKLGAINWDYQDSKEVACSFEFVFSNITAELIT